MTLIEHLRELRTGSSARSLAIVARHHRRLRSSTTSSSTSSPTPFDVDPAAVRARARRHAQLPAASVTRSPSRSRSARLAGIVARQPGVAVPAVGASSPPACTATSGAGRSPSSRSASRCSSAAPCSPTWSCPRGSTCCSASPRDRDVANIIGLDEYLIVRPADDPRLRHRVRAAGLPGRAQPRRRGHRARAAPGLAVG